MGRPVSSFKMLIKFRVNAFWVGIVSIILLLECITDFLPEPIGGSCENPSSHWHWLLIVIVDSIEMVLILICAVAMYALSKAREQTQREYIQQEFEQLIDKTDRDEYLWH